MKVLGITYYGHDSSAALVIDGKLVSAAEEERFTRKKHDSSFPFNSINYCLKSRGLKMKDIDSVAISMIPEEWIRGDLLEYSLKYFPDSIPLFLSKVPLIPKFTEYEKNLRENIKFDGHVSYYKHHECHFASSYYLSRFNNTCLLSMDGSGECQTALLGYASDNKVTILNEVVLPNSIGYLYDTLSVYLGFDYLTGAGKVMALASYGNPEKYIDKFRKIVKIDEENGAYHFDMSYFEYHKKRDVWYSDKFIETFGPKNEKYSANIDKKYLDIAAALQKRVEEVGLNAVNYLFRKTNCKNICLAGGVALNCVMNGRILKETECENIFVQPAAGDAGTAIGAALLHYYAKNPQIKQHYSLNDSYLGPEYSNRDIKKCFSAYPVKYEYFDNIEEEAAKMLADGKILGWFQGKMEFGPRALGNRSILTAPYPAGMKDILNDKVKHREPFRPFAPAVLIEDVDKYFDHSYESPYMLLVYNILKDKINEIPATAHVDGTGRVQTVNPGQNPRFYKLINEFKKITGISVILNTSFNDRGEPLVCSPDDAIKCFLKTKIDVLCIGNYILTKNTN